MTWEESAVSPSVPERASEVQASSEGMKYSDMCLLLEKQQKQIEDLTVMMKDLKDNLTSQSIIGTGQRSNSVPSVKNKDIICYYCKKTGHIKANCFKLKNRRECLNSYNPVAK